MSKSKQLTPVQAQANKDRSLWHQLTHSECEAIKGGFTPPGILEIDVSRRRK